MPKVRVRGVEPPEGWDLISDKLAAFDAKLRDGASPAAVSCGPSPVIRCVRRTATGLRTRLAAGSGPHGAEWRERRCVSA